MASNLIGSRIKALRQERGLSQDDVARLLGFKDRQTVSTIETGVRRVTAEELVLATEKLEVSFEYFTDPFRLEGEGRFSWRQIGVPSEQLIEYERNASRWIAAYRTLRSRVGGTTLLMRPSLALTRQSRYEDAIEAGERFATEFKLGAVPALRLRQVMEEKLDILVLQVDAYEGISGAACRLPELDAVLIARSEIAGRRNFDLAHELFHILTWEAMPPNHIEDAVETGGDRVEQLANNFASAVLMPSTVVARFDQWNQFDVDTLVAQLNTVASELKVTSSALRWRLVALGKLSARKAREIPDFSLRNNGGVNDESVLPELFSKSFAEVLGLALAQGTVSVRRAAALLDLSIDELSDLLAIHGVEFVVDQ